MSGKNRMQESIPLVIISPGFPKDESDTTCMVALQMLVRELQKKKELQLQVLSMHYPFEAKEYLWYGTPVLALGGSNKKGWRRILLFLKTWLSLNRILKTRGKLNVLSFLATDAALVAGYFCKFKHLNHFCWMVGQDTQKENHYLKFIPRSGRFLAISEFSKQNAEKNFGLRVEAILHNGLHLPSLPAYEIVTRDTDLIFVGSLIPLKRPEWLIELVKDLKQEGQLVRCLIVGDGPERNNLQNKIKLYGLEDQISMTGELSHPEVLKHMMRSKILLHPSSFEGFSTVCIEGLYAGCQVISTFSPFTNNQKDVHAVSTYDEFYTCCKRLLASTIPHSSMTEFTTAKTADQLMDLLRTAKN